MRARVQVSTDVAAIGIWDRRNDAAKLEELASQGEACIIGIGGDTGGSVDLFVDENIPPELLAESDAIPGERTIALRSGELIVDGVEFFGAVAKDRPDSVRLPSGVYKVVMYAVRNDDALPEPTSEKEIKRLVGAAEVEYYDRTNRNGLLYGLSTLIALPALLLLFRWFVAVPVALALFIAYFHARQWMLARNPRYQKVAGRIARMRIAGERPLLVVQLSRWHGEPAGGSPVRIDA